jgi:hypothetical protein
MGHKRANGVSSEIYPIKSILVERQDSRCFRTFNLLFCVMDYYRKIRRIGTVTYFSIASSVIGDCPYSFLFLPGRLNFRVKPLQIDSGMGGLELPANFFLLLFRSDSHNQSGRVGTSRRGFACLLFLQCAKTAPGHQQNRLSTTMGLPCTWRIKMPNCVRVKRTLLKEIGGSHQFLPTPNPRT